MVPSNHLILCCCLLLLPSVFPRIRVFSSELALRIRWLKFWIFNFNISPFSEYSGLIPLGWISLLSKGLSWVFSSTAIQKHQLFSTQASLWFYSHLYITTGKFMALTIWMFVGKVISLLFNTLSRIVIAFFQGASVLISWLQSACSVILEPKKIKSATASTFPPSICHEVMGLDIMILIFF